MKKTIFAALILIAQPVCAALSVSSSFLNIEGASGEQTNVIVDNSGAVIPKDQGYVSIGVFNLSANEIQTLTSGVELDAAFYQFGGSTNMNIAGGGFQSTATADVDSLYDGVNPYASNRVFVVIGNAVDLAMSTQFLVWDSGIDFSNLAPSGGPDTVTLDADTGALVVGRKDLHTFDMSGIGGSATELAFTLQALPVVPEPSSIALLGLGLMGFTLCRRR